MPLTGSETVLSAALRAAILAESYPEGFAPVDDPALTALCNAIAAAVIPHITANAVVTCAGASPGPYPGTIS